MGLISRRGFLLGTVAAFQRSARDFYQGSVYLNQPRPAVTWVVKDILPAGGFSNIYGKPKAGKSFLALGQAIAISSYKPHWMGYSTLTHGPVAYLQLDTPRSIWADRVQKAVGNRYDVSNIHFADTHPDDTNPESTPFPFNILLHGEWLKRQLGRIADLTGKWPVAIYLDTIRELHQGDENDSGAMKAMVAAVQDACGESAKIFVSHKKKEGQFHTDDLMNDTRGSSYVNGRMDSIIAVTTFPNQDTRGTMTWQSRTHPLKELKIIRGTVEEGDGIWRPNEEEQLLLAAIAEILADQSYTSDRERAEALAGKMGMTAEAARSHLKRKKDIFKPRLNKG